MYNTNWISACIFLLIPLLFISCKSNEIESSDDVNPERIYFDYRIWGEEDNDYITVKLQFRFGGPTGTTMLLDEPAGVTFNGVQLKADSSLMTGAYYEVIMDADEFAGHHSIVYTDINKKKHKEEFSFYPVSLKKPISAELKRGALLFELDGLDSLDYVRVLMMNTETDSRGINQVDRVRNGKVIISKEQLEDLASGPVHLELYKEVERPVKQATEVGGKISITYGLKREFVLKD
jgi:hypothetical protein